MIVTSSNPTLGWHAHAHLHDTYFHPLGKSTSFFSNITPFMVFSVMYNICEGLN